MRWVKTESSKPQKPRVIRIAFALLWVVAAIIVAVLTIRLPKTGALSKEVRIDRIVVNKSARELSVFRNGEKFKTYRVALGRQPLGAKEQEGDNKTPEGVYAIDYRNPRSDFHLGLHISYPDAEDTRRAAARGVSAGCDIMIHGLPNGHSWLGELYRQRDWTAGCIAMTDAEIEELWRITPDGTPIEIRQ